KQTLVLTELGESTKGEDRAVRDARRDLEKERQSAEMLLGSCKLLSVNSESLLEVLGKQREKILKERLLTRYPGMLTFLSNEENPIEWTKLITGIQFGGFNLSHLGTAGWAMLIISTLFAIVGALFLRNFTVRYLSRHREPTDFTGSLLNAVVRSLQRYGFGQIMVSTWALFWIVMSWEQEQLNPLALINLVLLGLLTVFALGRAFFAPIPPAMHYLPQSEEGCCRFWKGLRLLSIVLTGGVLFYLLPISAAMPEPLISLLRAMFGTLVVFSLIWVVWDALTLYGRRGLHMARFILIMALIVGLGAELTGFRNLSEYLIGGIILTLFLLGITWLLSMLFSDFCDSLDASRYNWQHRFRNWLGVEPGNYLPGVFWLRLLAGLSLWGGSTLILLRIWNVSSAKRAELLAYVTDGFSIGEVTIIPARIILALIILVILMSLVSRLKKQLDEHWLQKARMEAGARNAVASITAYTAAAIAIIVALSFAGVELSNLAIIAGALSVGIGFGLQNIVNNFVSGLILLFERPIQKGDWIVVGNTEGYVQKISIRSTQIQTFDRADVIVPNSELISAQVTNWMLHDLRGRVRVPIGVAYGSDAEKVKKILLKIAHEQSGVILDGSVTPPKVLFLGFGDSALNFELRYIIRNVDEKLQTLSDTNFAIDKAFQENDISIPFPQRDLHIRNWDPDRAKLDSTD
ncbi:MAG: mechanosensitive ion channel, partial [Gammaproteobacteria bacterium]|nr:mechanosensitive ion channel [Gammaproteobacteria bacterium]